MSNESKTEYVTFISSMCSFSHHSLSTAARLCVHVVETIKKKTAKKS